ncbi:hypothetical protein BDB01DRAFT_773914 [Pilobolus umbonatus]|nr:hypothetical protein BDB01DRAFT_773914 [Pilobolus umbonatus]
MITDYLEVGHVAVAIQLIESILGSERKPSFYLLVILINFMLESKTKYKTPRLQRNHWVDCNKTLGLLMDTLQLFGPSLFRPLWDQFGGFRLDPLAQGQEQDNLDIEELEEFDIKLLKEYEDPWSFLNHVLNKTEYNLEGRCHRLVAKFIIAVLQEDIKDCMENELEMKKSVLLCTLKKDAIGKYSKFNTYLDILFANFPSTDPELLQVVGDMTNMLITLSCFEEIIMQQDFLMAVYTQFQDLNAVACQALLQHIKYPTFIIALCDKALSDTNTSHVLEDHKQYRNAKHIPLHLEKLFYYVFCTIPHSTEIDSVYRHVIIVSKYCATILATSSTIHSRPNKMAQSLLAIDEVSFLIENRYDILCKWEALIEDLIIRQKESDTARSIRWCIELTKLSVLEYF